MRDPTTMTASHPDTIDHLARCDECQARTALAGSDVDLERAWSGTIATIWARRPGLVERLARRLFGSPGLARALVTTPSLALSWVLASAAVLGVGVLATESSATGTPWFALVAPALAAIAIAHAYGPGIDPAFELSQTMVVSDRLILLARGVTVFTINAVMTFAASRLFLTTSAVVWEWLMPMAAVATLALAVATFTQSANTGVGAAIAVWFGFVLAMGDMKAQELDGALQAALIPAYLLAIIVFLAVTLYATSGPRVEVRTWR